MTEVTLNNVIVIIALWGYNTPCKMVWWGVCIGTILRILCYGGGHINLYMKSENITILCMKSGKSDYIQLVKGQTEPDLLNWFIYMF